MLYLILSVSTKMITIVEATAICPSLKEVLVTTLYNLSPIVFQKEFSHFAE